jgi:hypothetical protein
MLAMYKKKKKDKKWFQQIYWQYFILFQECYLF